VILACGMVGLLAFAQPALGGQPVCGSVPKGTSQPVKATLALADTDPETVTAALYGRTTGAKQLTFVYTVTGCQLTDTLAPPEDPPPIGPPKDNKVATIPKGAIRIEGRPEVDGNQYVVHMQAFTAPPRYSDARTKKSIAPRFDPGTYGGFVHLKATWMHRTGTPVAISRSENRWLFVLGAAALGALGGFVFFMLLHAFSRSQLLASPAKVAIAAVVSVGVGTYVAYTTSYLNQDVWSFGANTIALLTAAFTAATSGHLVTGLLGKVYDDHAELNPTEPVRVEECARPGVVGLMDRMRHPVRTTKAAKLKRDGQQVEPERVSPAGGANGT
jgi:hypothetical protein